MIPSPYTPSIIAQFRERIEGEVQAMRQGMSGLATGTAQHKFIQAKIARIGEQQDQLTALVGEQQATLIVCQAYHKMMSEEDDDA